jgi:hypothetical protein
MARVKDLWFSEVPVKDAEGKTVRDAQGRPVTEKNKTKKHPDNGGSKDAKRWLACWDGTDGKEKTRAFEKKAAAEKYATPCPRSASTISRPSAVASRILTQPSTRTKTCVLGSPSTHIVAPGGNTLSCPRSARVARSTSERRPRNP